MSASSSSTRVESLLYISVWVALSSIVIVFNKWMLDRFPFSISLTTWHMLFATISTQILSRTTSLVEPCPDMNAGFYIKAILPIGLCYSLSLVLSNTVYLYLSMSFIQMLKAIGPVATLLACWSMGIRNPQPSLRVFMTVLVIVIGVAVSSLGELHFVLVGFLIQGAAVVSEAYKNALQQFLLSGKAKMSSMTLLYYFAPACTAINSLCILIFEMKDLEKRQSTGIPAWVFLANGFLCFGLNIASVTVIKKTSSLVLTLSGIPKSILLSLLDMVVYHTPISSVQAFGFTIAGAGTYYYSQLNHSTKRAHSVFEEKREDPPITRKIKDEESQLFA